MFVTSIGLLILLHIFQNIGFKESNNMTVKNNLTVRINLFEKQCHPVITWNKKHSLKQVISITYTLEKRVSSVATFEGL